MDDGLRNDKVNKAIARRYGKRVLAVRAMAGETAWLDGRILWRDGRVVWESEREGDRTQTVVPTIATLALAQRRLAQIGGYPRSSRRAFGDAAGWLARRLARLELAKRLQAISEPDIPALVERAQGKDSSVVARLVALLPAEACCLNDLPASPGEALMACGGRGADALRDLVGDEDALLAGRALAAMVLGAIHRQGIDKVEAGVKQAGWNARAYAWGLRHGWPADAPLVVALLAGPEGSVLAERFRQIEKQGSRFMLPDEELRELIARGTSRGKVGELCEACAAMEPAAVRIMQYRDRLEGVSLTWRRVAAAKLQDERRVIVAELIELVRKYALSTLDPALLYSLSQFAGMMLDLGNYPAELGESVLVVLRRGLELPVELRGSFFELLLEQFEEIWTAGALAEAMQVPGDGLVNWQYMWNDRQVYPISRLLILTREPDVVREALKKGLVALLSYHEWKDRDLYSLALRIVRELSINWRHWSLTSVLGGFANAKRARSTLDPLVTALTQARNPETRRGLAESAFDALSGQKSRVKEMALKLAWHLPRLVRFTESPGVDVRFCWRGVESTLVLDKAVGEEAAQWLDRLLGYLEELGGRGELAGNHDNTLRETLPFVVGLAAGDLERFGVLLRAALAHSFDYDSEQIEKGIKVLERFPALRDALARLFPLQPHRCMGLAVKMGFVSRLGKEAYAPLGYLEGPVEDEGLPEEWQGIVEVAPDAEMDARAYVRAKRLLGEGTDVPPGVRKALEQPRKLAEELVFLERRLAAAPGQAGMETRVENLRVRLANEGKMMSEVRAEVEEKLAQVAAEAQLEAAEAKMIGCYRLKLEGLAGALPPDFDINDDLVNAILLTCDVESNRRLLLKVLKAYVRGDRRWHERHPGNVRFLAQLAASGVDVDAWLGANPKRYRLPFATGGKVRLVLERNPLRVLQMGNYFDTCLSFGKFNSFSTVANACELNKRVIYAYDGAGRVVGRKLIGIDDKGKMVGFHTYSTLGEHEGKALRAIFRRYCSDFAERCGLQMTDEGSVSRLFAARWYDDGTVEWSDQETRPVSPTRTSVR